LITTNPPKRRRLTMSLGMLMLLILVLGLWLGRRTNMAREQRIAIAAVSSHGGWVHFDDEFVNGKLTPGAKPARPHWLRRKLGDEYFHQIRQVSFVYDDSTGKRYDNSSTKSCDDVLALLSTQSSLKSLLLKGTQATDRGLAHLRGLTGLEDLYIWDSTLISDSGVENLNGLVNLKNLHVDGSKVTDQGFQHLARLTKLEHLVLEKHSFSDRGLAAVKEMRGLTWLCVGGSPQVESSITDDGLAVVANLKRLQVLDLAYSKVTDRGLKQIAGLKQLTILVLSGSNVTDEGLAQLSGLQNLKQLFLSGTKVTGTGLRHLEGLKKLTVLSLPLAVSKESKQRFSSVMSPSLKVE
jgi:Leucine-rich repeat (LRR) protein